MASLRRVGLRERVLLWLLPTLVFRALIPVGFMPGAGSAFALELCSSAGFGSTFVAYDGDGTPVGHERSLGHEPCAFAAGAGIGPAPEIASPAAPAPAVVSTAGRTAPILSALQASLRPPPRAPPAGSLVS